MRGTIVKFVNNILYLIKMPAHLDSSSIRFCAEDAKGHLLVQYITDTVDSRYLEFQGKHFEISIPRHIRVEKVRKTMN